MPRVRSGRTACPLRARSDGEPPGFTVTHGRPDTRPTCVLADQRRCTAAIQAGDFPSPSLLDDLGRVLCVKANPLRGHFASLDTAATAKGWQLRGRRGGSRARKSPAHPRSTQDRRAICQDDEGVNHGQQRAGGSPGQRPWQPWPVHFPS